MLLGRQPARWQSQSLHQLRWLEAVMGLLVLAGSADWVLVGATDVAIVLVGGGAAVVVIIVLFMVILMMG